MAWFKIADGRLRFRGRITQEPVVEWLTSEDGVAAVQAAASQIRFALFGRTRAARRRMRRELWSVVDSPAMRARTETVFTRPAIPGPYIFCYPTFLMTGWSQGL